MPISWSTDIESIDWLALEHLYRVAPLGNKSAAHLKTVFTNSRFRCFAYQETVLVAAGRALADGADCSYICDVAVLPEHQGSGLGKEVVNRLVEASRDHLRMLTAMAIFQDKQAAIATGHLGEA